MENPLKQFIETIKTGSREDVKEAQKQIEKFWHTVYIPRRKEGKKAFLAFLDEIQNFKNIHDINHQAYCINTLKWPIMVLGEEFYENWADFFVQYIQHPSGIIRQAILRASDYFIMEIGMNIPTKMPKKISDAQKKRVEKSKKNFCLFALRVEKLLAKYHQPKFDRYKYIDKLPPSIYKSLQILMIQHLFRNPRLEKIFLDFVDDLKQANVNKKAPNMRAMEKTFARVHKAMDKKEFESEEEMKAFLSTVNNVNDLPDTYPNTPLEKAQELIYDAWEADYEKRVQLAFDAITIYPDCADAYVILAEEIAESFEEEKILYERGVEAGIHSLGAKMFKENNGHFWGVIETRPYMRARAGLAQALWLLGEKDVAMQHYREMLKLNPNDNQGLRYILGPCLFDTKQYEELGRLLKKYDEPTADWLYNKALYYFQKEREGKNSNKVLLSAIQVNSFVPDYLLEKKQLPKMLPAYISVGREDEAQAYTSVMISQWKKIPEAIEWLKKIVLENK